MKEEKTFVILKADAVQRSLMGEIIARFEKKGLKISGMKMIMPTREQAVEHYDKDDDWCINVVGNRIVKKYEEANGEAAPKTALEYGREVLEALYSYLIASPVVILSIQGGHAVDIVSKIVGSTEPLTCDIGTIRGDFTIDSYEIANADNRAIRNLIHCSESIEEALRETSVWFKEGEILEYNTIQEKIMYDVNADGHWE